MTLHFIENEDNIHIKYINKHNDIFEETFYIHQDIIKILCSGDKKEFIEMMRESAIFEEDNYVKLKRRHPRVSLKLYKDGIFVVKSKSDTVEELQSLYIKLKLEKENIEKKLEDIALRITKNNYNFIPYKQHPIIVHHDLIYLSVKNKFDEKV